MNSTVRWTALLALLALAGAMSGCRGPRAGTRHDEKILTPPRFTRLRIANATSEGKKVKVVLKEVKDAADQPADVNPDLESALVPYGELWSESRTHGAPIAHDTRNAHFQVEVEHNGTMTPVFDNWMTQHPTTSPKYIEEIVVVVSESAVSDKYDVTFVWFYEDDTAKPLKWDDETHLGLP